MLQWQNNLPSKWRKNFLVGFYGAYSPALKSTFVWNLCDWSLPLFTREWVDLEDSLDLVTLVTLGFIFVNGMIPYCTCIWFGRPCEELIGSDFWNELVGVLVDVIRIFVVSIEVINSTEVHCHENLWSPRQVSFVA